MATPNGSNPTRSSPIGQNYGDPFDDALKRCVIFRDTGTFPRYANRMSFIKAQLADAGFSGDGLIERILKNFGICALIV
jgi:hypothetical protein